MQCDTFRQQIYLGLQVFLNDLNKIQQTNALEYQ